MKTKQLVWLHQLYSEGRNLLEFFREQDSVSCNSTESIQISYDFQAGTYIEAVEKDPEFNFKYTNAIAQILKSFSPGSILEAGVGEATTLINVLSKLKDIPDLSAYGFDLSWSRIKCAQEYAEKKQIKDVFLCTGDLFHCPFQKNSIDIVYTSHSIEPNGGREEEALKELYSICSKYLILLEPAYEFANEEAKVRMRKHGYITRLEQAARNLGYKILTYRPFDFSANPLNPTGVMIIEKNSDQKSLSSFPLACPVTKTPLQLQGDCYYSRESLLVYPIVAGVPCSFLKMQLSLPNYEKAWV